MARMLEGSEIRQSENGPSIPIQITKQMEAAAWRYNCATAEELARQDPQLYAQIINEAYDRLGLDLNITIGVNGETS